MVFLMLLLNIVPGKLNELLNSSSKNELEKYRLEWGLINIARTHNKHGYRPYSIAFLINKFVKRADETKYLTIIIRKSSMKYQKHPSAKETRPSL